MQQAIISKHMGKKIYPLLEVIDVNEEMPMLFSI